MAAALLASSACGSGSPETAQPGVQTASTDQQGATPLPVSNQEKGLDKRVYRLDSGDRLEVRVFGESNLSGEVTIDESGRISLPLIGSVRAAGRSVAELEKVLVEKFGDGYLRYPQVSVQVLNYRPFYVLGEVKNPGSYDYERGMTALNAVALAGGYTPRAREDVVYLERPGDDIPGAQPVAPDTKVLPGDIVHVRQRTLF